MTRRHIGTLLDRKAINDINDNFKELFNYYIKSGLDAAEAREKAIQAVADAEIAKETAETTREEMLAIIREQTQNGDLAPEIAQARQGKATLGENLNSIKSELADTDNFRRYESMINRKQPLKPMITITDDDGNVGFYTILFELAKEYNVPITSAMITNSAMGFPGDNRPVTRQYNYEQVMEMKESGLVEFVSHTHHHENLLNQTDDFIHRDFKDTINFMRKYGFNHRGVVYPNGGYDERILNIAKQYFDYSTGTGTGIDAGREIVTAPANNYRLGRFNLNRPFSQVKGKIDQAVNVNGWLILIGHIDQQEATKEDYRQIIEYGLSVGAEFVTLEEGLKTHGNIAQFGGSMMEPESTISANGTIVSKLFGNTPIFRDTSVSADTPLGYFKSNSVTRNAISPNQGGFPDGVSGFLDTHRYTRDSVFSYQRFTSTRDKREYIRYWDTDESRWTNWINSTGVHYLGVNAVSLNDKPTSPVLARKVSYTNINSQANSMFPEQKSGTLITNALTLDDYAYQEYRIYKSRRIYHRFYNQSESKWSGWRLVRDEIGAKITTPPNNDFTGTTNRDEFEWGITYSTIGEDTPNKGTPDNQAGMIITHKVVPSPPRHNFQEFQVYATGKMYRRQGTGETSNGWEDNWKEV